MLAFRRHAWQYVLIYVVLDEDALPYVPTKPIQRGSNQQLPRSNRLNLMRMGACAASPYELLNLKHQMNQPSSWWRVEDPGGARAWRQDAPAPPRQQVGFVRLWPARAVDVRLIWGARPARELDEQAPEPDGETEWDAPDDLARRLALALQPPPQIWLDDNGALEWVAPLFPFQIEGVQTLLELPRLLLADEMGLGKSVQAIAALRILLHRREIGRALLVVPASLLEQWRREWRKWAPEIVLLSVGGAASNRRWQWRYRAHITLVSYEMLRADSTLKNGPLQQEWGVVVLDEAQKIKNADAEISRVCLKLPRARSWITSGTPLENSVEDLVSLLEFLTGQRLSGWQLRAALQTLQLRRRKSEVLPQLPPKISADLPIELAPAQRKSYDRAREEGVLALQEGGTIHVENVLALLTRLKQICNFDPGSGASAKADDLRARLKEIGAQGHKSLVFTQFSDDRFGARRLATALGELSPLVYTGDLSASERTAILDRFANDENAKVLILSLRAGGQGLNLPQASYVFHFDRWWNPAIEAQAEARAHRLGQDNPVLVYRYVSPATVEERIQQVLQDKAELFEQMVEGATLEPGRLLSRADLMRAVGLQ